MGTRRRNRTLRWLCLLDRAESARHRVLCMTTPNTHSFHFFIMSRPCEQVLIQLKTACKLSEDDKLSPLTPTIEELAAPHLCDTLPAHFHERDTVLGHQQELLLILERT